MKRIALIFSILLNHNFYSLINAQEVENNLKIAIIGAHNESYHRIGKYAHINKQRYAEKHGYSVFLYEKNLVENVAPQWNKIAAIQAHIENYDWLFWADSDALIMNNKIKLESLLDNSYDIIIAQDCFDRISSGVFLIKNSKWSRDFLKAWYSKKEQYTHTTLKDNGALLKLLNSNPEFIEHIKVVPQRMLGSYLNMCPKNRQETGEYQEGDFIIHFSGRSRFYKEKRMKEYFDKTQSKGK